MISRGHVSVLFLFLATSIFAYSQVQISRQQPANETGNALHGKVLNAEGRPASGIHIELDNASTAIPVGSTFTDHDGTFELYNIPQGEYEVIAESDNSEVSSEVSVQSSRPTLQLRFRRNSSAADDLDPTISVARMLVPQRAQKMYARAYTDFMKGKFDKANQELDGALQIDPEYANALTLRALMMIDSRDLCSARQLLEQSVQIDPSDSAAYIALAAIYNHEGRFNDAMRLSEKSLLVSPESWQAYLELAKASIAKDMYQHGLL